MATVLRGLQAMRMVVPRRAVVMNATQWRGLHLEATTESIQQAIAKEPVLVFSKTYCPYCARVKALFEDLEAEHTVVELDTRPDGDRIQALLQDMTKQRTVPNVFVKGKHLGGCDDVIELYAQKKLQPMLQ